VPPAAAARRSKYDALDRCGQGRRRGAGRIGRIKTISLTRARVTRARVALMLSILPILPKSTAPVALNYLGPISSQNVCGITWREGSLVTLGKNWVDRVDLVDAREVDDVHCR